MRQFDFSPLYRATVGFDQIADMFDRVLTLDNQTSSYPPYDIEKVDEDAYRISIAVAGFSEADLNVEVRENTLFISAGKTDEKQKNLPVVFEAVDMKHALASALSKSTWWAKCC